jgi:hypothetical protein
MKTFIKTRNYMTKKNRKKGAMVAKKTPINKQLRRGNNQVSAEKEKKSSPVSKFGMAVIFIFAKNQFYFYFLYYKKGFGGHCKDIEDVGLP